MQYHSSTQQVAATGGIKSRIHRSNGRRTLRARRVSFSRVRMLTRVSALTRRTLIVVSRFSQITVSMIMT
jgi:hypothetical protein